MHTIPVSVWETNSNIKFAPELWKLKIFLTDKDPVYRCETETHLWKLYLICTY